MRHAVARARRTGPPDGVRAERTPEGRVFLRGGMSAAQALQAVQAHRSAMSGRGGQVAKRDVKTNVTLIEWDGSLGADRLCVKEFVRAGSRRLLPRWIRHRPAIVSWRGASRLAALGIGAPDTLGLVIGKGASSYLVMRALEGFESPRGVRARRAGPGDADGTPARLPPRRSGLPRQMLLPRASSTAISRPAISSSGRRQAAAGSSRCWTWPRCASRAGSAARTSCSTWPNSTPPFRSRSPGPTGCAFCGISPSGSRRSPDRSAMAEIARLTRSRRCVWSR